MDVCAAKGLTMDVGAGEGPRTDRGPMLEGYGQLWGFALLDLYCHWAVCRRPTICSIRLQGRPVL